MNEATLIVGILLVVLFFMALAVVVYMEATARSGAKKRQRVERCYACGKEATPLRPTSLLTQSFADGRWRCGRCHR